MRREDPVLNAAAEWFDRLQHEHFSAEDLAAWQKWLGESPDHQIAFDSLQEVWQRLEAAEPPALADARTRAADAYTGETSVAQWQAQTESARSHRHGDRDASRRGWKRAAGFALIVSAGVVGSIVAWKAQQQAPAIYQTAAGEHREVALPDGSTLTLGAKSLAWIEFAPGARNVTLERGEAFFEVAKDSRRPFTVHAGRSSITAVGTAFNVRRSGERVSVSVAQGAVKVAPSAEHAQGASTATQLVAGDQLVLNNDTAAPVIRRSSPESAASWRSGQLEYRDEPLLHVVEDVNRYSTTPILIAQPELGDLRVTGTVFENDIEGWLESIGEFLPVRVERTENAVVIRKESAPRRTR